MAGSHDDLLTKFRDDAIEPACVDFAARIGAKQPSPLVSGPQAGYEIRLPSALKDGTAKTVVVCAEPFDDEAFTVKASRPDAPDQLRRIALVRYDALQSESKFDDESTRIRGAIGNALEQLHQGLTNR
ncbi:MAG: hypothetical protein WBC44_16285 [Planctomycetaceae bacterium]